MTTHNQIVEAFILNRGPKKGSKIFREPWGNGDTIYSYGHHFPMAVRYDEDKIFLLNGDRYSSTTTQHQNHVRSAIANRSNYSDYKTLTVPFSIFGRAYRAYSMEIVHFNLIDVGKDREIIKCLTCEKDFDSWNELDQHKRSFWKDEENYKGLHKTLYFHQLAPSIFTAKIVNVPHYFISAFDETANRRNHDGYFLSELPHKPRNIAQAYEMLKPQAVKDAEKKGLKIIRQGDIFAIPTDLDTRTLKRKGAYSKSEMVTHGYWNRDYKVLEYPRLLGTSHVVNEVVSIGDKVYARGTIRHKPTEFGRSRPEHINMTLGKVWHRIARNTALASYSTGGRVD